METLELVSNVRNGLSQLWGTGTATEAQEAQGVALWTQERILEALAKTSISSAELLCRLVELATPDETYFVPLDSVSADAQLVTRVAGCSIEVVSAILFMDGAKEIKFLSGGSGGRPLTGSLSVAANGSLILPAGSRPYFRTFVEDGLYADITGANNVDGVIGYTLKRHR